MQVIFNAYHNPAILHKISKVVFDCVDVPYSVSGPLTCVGNLNTMFFASGDQPSVS